MTGPLSDNPLQRMLRKRAVLSVWGLLSSALFIWLMVARMDWHAIERAFQACVWLPWIPLAIACYVAGMLLRGLRLKYLVQNDANLTLKTGSNIVAIGYAANNILPARMGELVRAGMLMERTGLPYAQSLAVTFMERLLDGLVIVLLFGLASQWIHPAPWMQQVAQYALLILSSAAIFVSTVGAHPRAAIMFISRVMSHADSKWHDRAVSCMEEALRGLNCLRDGKTTLLMLLLSALIWVWEAGLFLFLLPCFNLPLRVARALVIMSFTNIGIMIPSSPGYLGTYHFCCKSALLSVFSVVPGGDAQALSYAVIVHLVFYATTTIWGVLAFMRYGFESLKVVTMAWEAQPLKTLPEESLSTMKVISLLPEQQVKGSAVSPFLFSLTEAFIPPQYPAMDPVSRHEAFERASEFVAGQLAALPWLLKFPLAMGLNCFRVCVWLKTFSDFTALPVGQRHQLVRAYAFDGNGFWRKLFRPVRSICVLAFFEDESVKAALDNKSNRAASSMGAKNA